MELVVVEETDDPRPLAGVRYISHPIANRGISYARNLAVANASGDLLAFVDDDCVISDGWLNRLLEPFSEESVVGVQGGVTVPEYSNAIGWAESLLGFPGGGIARVIRAKGQNQETREISTLNCAYRRWVIERIGGFDENLTLGSEDYLLAKRACLYGRCLFVPAAWVYHAARGRLEAIWPWFSRRGRAEMQLVLSGKLQEKSVTSTLTKSVTLKVLPLFLAGVLFPRLLFPLLMTAAVTYYLVQLARHFKVWKSASAPLSAILLLPVVRFIMDSAMDWGRLRGIGLNEKFPGHL
jgi:GT2 family glycosyltransferase